MELVITPEKEKPAVITFCIKKKETPKKVVLGAEQAPVLIPFWVLANEVEKGDEPSGARALAYATSSISMPSLGNISKKTGHQKAKDNVKIRMLYATNKVKLTKGERIYLRESPPQVLPAE